MVYRIILLRRQLQHRLQERRQQFDSAFVAKDQLAVSNFGAKSLLSGSNLSGAVLFFSTMSVFYMLLAGKSTTQIAKAIPTYRGLASCEVRLGRKCTETLPKKLARERPKLLIG